MKPVICLLFLAAAKLAAAHCDTLDGPVVADARAALGRGEVTPALKWVKPAGESEVRAAFARASAVRKQGGAAAELADQWFFETLVRVHRAGENAPFTGIAPAGSAEPAVVAADRAIATGNMDVLTKELTASLSAAAQKRFARVVETRKHAEESMAAGREYVAAYTELIHFLERVRSLTAVPASPPAEPANEHRH